MSKIGSKNLYKKDIMFVILLVVNLALVTISIVGYFRLDNRINNSQLMADYEKLVMTARTQCLAETQRLECEYIKVNEHLSEKFRQDHPDMN